MYVAKELKFYLSDDDQAKFKTSIDSLSSNNERVFYAQHIHFQNVSNAAVYINFIREPVSRFISHFYFRRYSSGKATKDGAAFIGHRY